MEFIGMDSGEVRTLAGRLRNQADAISSIVAAIDGVVHQIGGQWTGQDASTFIGWWQQQHRPNLVRVQEQILGLAQSADNNASQQDRASSAGSSPAGATTFERRLTGAANEAQRFSNQWGFAAGPLLTDIPKLGGPVGSAFALDQDYRIAQDVAQHHYQALFETSSGIVSSSLMDEKTPVGFLAGGDVIIGTHVERAARAINWSYTVSHPSELNPFAPGAMAAVGQAELQGFTSLAGDLVKGAVGALLSW